MSDIHTATIHTPGPGLARLRKSKSADAVRAATTADQKAARAAAAAKAATTPAKRGGKRSQRSPSESGKVAKAASKPTKAAKPASGKAATIKVISRENPYRPGSVLASMRALLRDGMSTADLAAAFKAAGIKGTVSGFLHNARSKGLVE